MLIGGVPAPLQPALKKASDLRVMLVSMKFAFGDPTKGLSYEWSHFYLGLRQEFKTLDFFDFMFEIQTKSKNEMNAALLKKASRNNYDVIIVVPFEHQFDRNVICDLRKFSKTFCFFHDDSWRQDFARYWGPCFDAFSTTDSFGEDKYRWFGEGTPIYFPFGVNTEMFSRSESVARDIELSFIGTWHPRRAWMLKKLAESGIAVNAFGYGFDGGVLSIEAMVDVFRRSKISLNLSNSISFDLRYLLSSLSAVKNALKSHKTVEQLKGRHFEIPACGAMQLSFYAEGLERQFQIGKEIAIFNSAEDLILKTKYYLANERSRVEVARAGYRRVIEEHQYQRKFVKIFKDLGWCI